MSSSSDLQPFTRNDVIILVIATALGITFPLAECRAQADSAISQPGAGVGDTEAAKRAAELFDFQLAQKLDSKEGWEAFLKAHPSGVSAVWAKKRLAEIEKDASRPGAVAPSGSEQASTPPVERNRSIRNISINIGFSERQEEVHTRNGKTINTKVENKDSTTAYSILVDPDVLSVTETESAGVSKFRCGLDRPIITSVPVLEPLGAVDVKCSYSHVGQVYSLNWSYEGSSGARPKFDPGRLHGSAALTISLAEDGCKIVESKGNSRTETLGHPHRFTTNSSSAFKSGSCVAG